MKNVSSWPVFIPAKIVIRNFVSGAMPAEQRCARDATWGTQNKILKFNKYRRIFRTRKENNCEGNMKSFVESLKNIKSRLVLLKDNRGQSLTSEVSDFTIEKIRIGINEIKRKLLLRKNLEIKHSERLRFHFQKLIEGYKNARLRGDFVNCNFDLFGVVGFKRNEEMHSNVISWFLNPEESHGWRAQFLRSLMKKVYQLEVDEKAIYKVSREVQEEGDRVDIFVKSKNFLLIIENKIDSEEHGDQTIRYSERYDSENPFCIYLTPKELPPKSERFRLVSYSTIRNILEELVPSLESSFFVNQFIKHIKNNLEV